MNILKEFLELCETSPGLSYIALVSSVFLVIGLVVGGGAIASWLAFVINNAYQHYHDPEKWDNLIYESNKRHQLKVMKITQKQELKELTATPMGIKVKRLAVVIAIILLLFPNLRRRIAAYIRLFWSILSSILRKSKAGEIIIRQ